MARDRQMASESEQREVTWWPLELFKGDHHVVVIFRLGSEDSQEAGAVVDSNDGLSIAAD